MAGKKGQPVQLQTEVNTDDEWDKLLQKDGLIVVDVYSDWCGPCLGMQANLKKLKLDIGGDMLQLAMAKSDGISRLERFRNKSEPTWMFLSKGKMVNLMFGADAPKLTRLIAEELKKEQLVQNGQTTDRTPMEVTDLADEEKVRFDAKEAVNRVAREKEEKKKAKELLERRTKECENIVKNLTNFGTAIVFPSAKDKYKEVLNDLLEEAGLLIHQTDKVRFTEEKMTELCFFSDKDAEFTEEEQQQLYENDALVILFKANPRAEVEDIDHAILQMIYGEHMKPPGSQDCMARKVLNLINAEEARPVTHPTQANRQSTSAKSAKSDEQHDPSQEHPDENHEKKPEEQHQHVWTKALWAPHTPFLRATALKLFFAKYSSDFTLAPPEPTPDHIAVVFSFTKKTDVMQIVQENPKEIMAYGFFTSANADEAKLVAKTVRKLEKATETLRTFEEKLVLKVSKKKSEVVFAFAQLGPLYMSPNANEGKIECEKFFPEGYVEEEEEDVEEEPKPVKKPKKMKAQAQEEGSVETGESEEAQPIDEDEAPKEIEEVEPTEVEEEGEQIEEDAIVEGQEIGHSDTAIEGLPEVPIDVLETRIPDEWLEELLFFAHSKWPKKTIEDFANNKLCYALLFKRSSEALTGNIDEVVLQAIYGNSRKPPGDENSPSQKLRKDLEFKPKDEEPTEQEIFENVLLGIWAPPNALTRGAILKLMFPTISGPFRMPDLKEVPLHVVVAYDAFKAKDVMELSEKYPGQVMNYGYFSTDVPGEAQLIAKTTEKFEARTVSTTYEEKIIIQLAKVIPECYMEFCELGPSYISRDVDVGEKDSVYFFPADYNKPEVEIINFLKKKTKRKGKFGKIPAPLGNPEDGVITTATENAPEASEANPTEAETEAEEATIIEENNEEDNEEEAEDLLEEEGKDDIEDPDLATNEDPAKDEDETKQVTDISDKATSPVAEN